MSREVDYKKLERLGARLGLAVPSVFISVRAEKYGKKTGGWKGRSHTWNRNFWNANLWLFTGISMGGATFGAGYLNMKNTDGTISAFGNTNSNWHPIGILGDNSYGIQVGTGTGAESFEGYVIGTLIAHGNAATQLYYQAHSAASSSYNAGTRKWTISIKRIFNNNSGGTITVTETTLVFLFAQVTKKVMLNRDLLGASVAVLTGGQLTVQYDITLILPA